jgi:hypothetical protein
LDFGFFFFFFLLIFCFSSFFTESSAVLQSIVPEHAQLWNLDKIDKATGFPLLINSLKLQKVQPMPVRPPPSHLSFREWSTHTLARAHLVAHQTRILQRS